MEIKDLETWEEMMENFDLIHEMYPSITREEYAEELKIMIPCNYKQVVVIEQGQKLGLSGYWIGNKLWCGKYLELDNIIVSSKFRSQGVGKLIFEYLENKGKDAGCTMLALDSYTSNFKAHKFFYNEGFAPKGFHFIKIMKEDKVR